MAAQAPELFNFSSAREYVNARIGASTGGNRTEFLGIAQALHLHSAQLEELLREKKSLGFDHGLLLVQHFKFSWLEAQYFFQLVLHDECAEADVRELISARLAKLRSWMGVPDLSLLVSMVSMGR